MLTSRSWSGADLSEVVSRANAPFALGQFTVAGCPVDLSPKLTLALSLALHELATNAAKYGALSRPGGRIEFRWDVQDAHLHLNWRERDGPQVCRPTRRGFGSRLLGEGLLRDLDGQTKLEFAPEGVCYSITAGLVAATEQQP